MLPVHVYHCILYNRIPCIPSICTQKYTVCLFNKDNALKNLLVLITKI